MINILILSVQRPSLYVRIYRIKTIPALKGLKDYSIIIYLFAVIPTPPPLPTYIQQHMNVVSKSILQINLFLSNSTNIGVAADAGLTVNVSPRSPQPPIPAFSEYSSLFEYSDAITNSICLVTLFNPHVSLI